MYVTSPTLDDGIDLGATFTGWSAPNYASDWNDVVQIVYARANNNENKRQGTTVAREYVTKSEVGMVIDAYRKLRGAGKIDGYNPRSSDAQSKQQTIQSQLGTASPSLEKIAMIMREFYDAVFGSPQQIALSWYTAGVTYQHMTEQEKARSSQNAKDSTTEKPEECGLFCTIGNSIKSIFSLPGQLAQSAGQVAQGATTTASMFQIGFPILILGGTAFALWVVGRKVLEMDADELGATVATRGTNKIVKA